MTSVTPYPSPPTDLGARLAARAVRVGVLFGGMSSERAVSLKSGHAVHGALRTRGWDAVEIDVGPDLPRALADAGVEVAFLALHGPFGEDGCVQGLLEVLRVPYTGSGVLASAVAMDKIATKRILAGTGVRLAADLVWRSGDPFPTGLAFPVVAKTPAGGSTIGTYVCPDAGSLERALADCLDFEDRVLIEQAVQGEEITVAVLDGRALPVVSIRPVAGHFDFEAKYTRGRTEYLVPAPITSRAAEDAVDQALAAWAALGLSGVARADFIVDGEDRAWFLEFNTIPGMTATSLSPMAAAAIGMSFEDLVEAVLLGARLHTRVAAPDRVAQPGSRGPGG